jgi:hypothetical protein
MFQSSPINPTFDQGTSMSIGTEQETTSQASQQIQTPPLTEQDFLLLPSYPSSQTFIIVLI